MMKQHEIKSSMILLLAAAIWGFAFVAQKSITGYLGAFTYTGIRFALGSLVVLPFYLYNRKKDKGAVPEQGRLKTILGGILAGIILFAGVSLQQLGLFETEAGKAAFITGLYIVFVPILGLLFKHKTTINTWLGAILAILGLYLLSIKGGMAISRGDMLELCGAFFWAIHIILIDRLSNWIGAIKLSLIQFITCSAISLAVAIIFEKIELASVLQASIPIIYGGVFSVGIAYTLQVVGQKHAKPSHAAIVLSMETVFASIGGLLILNENLGLRGYAGCLLMLVGMLLSQLKIFGKRELPIQTEEMGS
jgi:drug/metabolite transporter (DMT)-like permease